MGALEIHVWGSRSDRLEYPDRLIFDLDPDPSVAWARVVESAGQLRQMLSDLGLDAFLKTTGGKGLHLVVPIARRTPWPEAAAFAKAVAEAVERADPARYTANLSKKARSGKIFLDYLRNNRGSVAVAPYSSRSKPGATVSVPLRWDELKPSLASDQFTVRNLPARLDSLRQDPWEGIGQVRQSITRTMIRRLEAEHRQGPDHR